jgi:hypothetical protein
MAKEKNILRVARLVHGLHALERSTRRRDERLLPGRTA